MPTTAEIKIPFLEGLKFGAGCFSEYMSHTEFTDGQGIGRRLTEATASVYKIEELRREVEALKALVESQSIKIQALTEDIRRKDNHWGQF